MPLTMPVNCGDSFQQVSLAFMAIQVMELTD
jgi:hypothetical protein